MPALRPASAAVACESGVGVALCQRTPTWLTVLAAVLLMAPAFGQIGDQSLAPKPLGDVEDDKGEGRRLMQSLINVAPTAETVVYGTFKIRDAEDKRTQIPVRWMLKLDGESWHDVYETRTVAGIPAERLIVTRQEGKPNRYALAKFSVEKNEFELPVALTGKDLFEPFAGTDFWRMDLGLEFFHWPDAKIVKREMRKGQSCRVVKSINPSPTVGGYSRILSWIAVDSGGLVRAEAYDRENKFLKEFSIKHVTRIQKRWHIKEVEMRNEQTDSRTALEFDIEVEAP